MFVSTICVCTFAYSVWRLGKVEDKLAAKYFWMLNDQEMADFNNNSANYIQKIKASLQQGGAFGGQANFQGGFQQQQQYPPMAGQVPFGQQQQYGQVPQQPVGQQPMGQQSMTQQPMGQQQQVFGQPASK
mmetsp:Transcript_36852/g.56416  ORF Transcript_36852/g.56416 Transcript_36852/m.56416 type:complete len:130 (-) Transcript_36852:62-451(-)|eukprot:CAMPEP_0170496326 /NCGR_PEP_ID=MMETSP0208-20121228/21033_1 /TAXON_ID=197538 /ORGANISM="Strombidium inclinatum, Strain S3" /LENGTH=129 /DNA_ID=CAMNT_0010772841 /DNA_START=453 /DNA_END=842 /DNA_ORIENTATION=+